MWSKKITNENIIANAYDLYDVLYKIIWNLKNVIIIVDEHHNLSNENINNVTDSINKIINSDNKILYISATSIYIIKYDAIYKYDWNITIKKYYWW